MAEQTPNQTTPAATGPAAPTAAGPAERALSAALATAFRALRWVMIVVLVALLFSNTRFLRQNQRAVILRFGRIVGTGPRRVHTAGLVLAWPRPIDEIVVVDADRVQVLEINDFMYRPAWQQDPGQALDNVDVALDPGQDGYSLTSDANVLHTQWRVSYMVNDVISYALHVDNPEKAIRTALAASVVDMSARMTINQVLGEALQEFIDGVQTRLQARLDEANTGILIDSLSTPKHEEPLQTKAAFALKVEKTQGASAARQRAERIASDKLADAAGEEGKPLAALLDKLAEAEAAREGEHDQGKIDEIERQIEELLETASGDVAIIRGEATAYETEVVADAEAMEAMLADLGPKWREHPRVFITQLYQNAMQEVLGAAGVKFAVYPRQRQIWILLEPQYKKPAAEQKQGLEPTRSKEERQRMQQMGG
jgi:regulator of protease activity HflC (stomatin/prohibitin superfamily)